MEDAIDRFIVLEDFGHGVAVRTREDFPQILALEIYRRDLEKTIFRTLRPALGAQAGMVGPFCPVFPNSERAKALALVSDLRRRIHQLAAKPIRPELIEGWREPDRTALAK